MSAFTEITPYRESWPPMQQHVILFRPSSKQPFGALRASYTPVVEYIYSEMTCQDYLGYYWRPLDKGDYPEGMMP